MKAPAVKSAASMAARLAPHLPGLRRYGRALSGSQRQGDALVAATLAALIAEPALFPADLPPRLALFRAFHALADPLATAGPAPLASLGAAGVVAARLARLMPLPRQALLLAAMEGFAPAEIALLIDQPAGEILALIDSALADIARQTRSRVLIIEDEPIIAMDIEAIVAGLGHDVCGIAATRAEALALAAADPPGLILADIQLRDGSSGIAAVRDLVARVAAPSIFITGFPERLLTGRRPEPAFLISKPFAPASVAAAIAQALFFAPPASPLPKPA